MVQLATSLPPSLLDMHTRFLLERIHGVPQSLARNRVKYGSVEGLGRLSFREQGRLGVRIAYRRKVRGEVLPVSGAILPLLLCKDQTGSGADLVHSLAHVSQSVVPPLQPLFDFFLRPRDLFLQIGDDAFGFFPGG